MNKKIAFMAFAVCFAASVISSCGDDKNDENSPQTELPVQGAITGWTRATHVPPEGGRKFFVNYHSPNETATVQVTRNETGLLTLAYASDAWGKAEFAALQAEAKDGKYILPAGQKTTIVMERGAFGQAGGGEYELTLVKGEVDDSLKHIKLTMSAFMNPNHGSYQLEFMEGDAPAPVVE